MNSADSFSADYGQARTKFLEAAVSTGGELESLQHPEKGPDGASLFVDIASFGASDAPKRLVLISGTHGVEGFCGSGAQVDFLRRGEIANLPRDFGVLLIHAINPHGFAWLRRVTHEGIDLNRNWIDFSHSLPENLRYSGLSAAIVPPEWEGPQRDMADAVLAEFAAREGAASLNQAMSGGQYHYATGIFYGGVAPSWSRIAQTSIFNHYLARSRAIAIIDYHTGLGPRGFAEQIAVCVAQSDIFQRARRWYGMSVTSNESGNSVAALIDGAGLSAAPSLLPDCEVTGIAFEVGTLPRQTVRTALRADAWLHAYGDPNLEIARIIRRQMRDAYYVDSDDWKGMVAGQSLLTCRQAMAGLATVDLG